MLSQRSKRLRKHISFWVEALPDLAKGASSGIAGRCCLARDYNDKSAAATEGLSTPAYNHTGPGRSGKVTHILACLK